MPGAVVVKSYIYMHESEKNAQFVTVNPETNQLQIIYVERAASKKVEVDTDKKTLTYPQAYSESFKPVEFMGNLVVLRIKA